ncbi:FixH family protein [Pseudoroseicyclus tamaricis]|uniref:FixH family protein n=1 Tax=Pseudoroseicyclus tamaricis TaxID=2705421 RepID=A0A6B2K3T3_9RHOB|nr:FixH family protein [Pseudoroseicyclus tamaricis]NDV01276.1 FixH family protein [Pseudoroseicyclus tamaricis]
MTTRPSSRPLTGRPLTGRAVFAMFAGGFGIIIAVNLVLATNAVRTFSGLETPNSYVASQSFDARRAAQEALGWEVTADYAPGSLLIDLTDATGLRVAQPLALTIGRPTEELDDTSYDVTPGDALPLDLAPGRWRLDLTAEAPDGTPFERHLVIEVAS